MAWLLLLSSWRRLFLFRFTDNLTNKTICGNLNNNSYTPRLKELREYALVGKGGWKMNPKKIVFLSVFIVSVLVAAFVASAQEPAGTQTDSTLIASGQPVNSENKNDLQWIWGSITNLDNQAKTFTVKYFDYETDQEKELVLSVDEKTTFENMNGLDELKVEDTLSVDYSLDADNKNIAKNVSLEKPDVISAQLPKAQTEAPVISPLEVAQAEVLLTTQPETIAIASEAQPEVAQPELAVQQQD